MWQASDANKLLAQKMFFRNSIRFFINNIKNMGKGMGNKELGNDASVRSIGVMEAMQHLIGSPVISIKTDGLWLSENELRYKYSLIPVLHINNKISSTESQKWSDSLFISSGIEPLNGRTLWWSTQSNANEDRDRGRRRRHLLAFYLCLCDFDVRRASLLFTALHFTADSSHPTRIGSDSGLSNYFSCISN